MRVNSSMLTINCPALLDAKAREFGFVLLKDNENVTGGGVGLAHTGTFVKSMLAIGALFVIFTGFGRNAGKANFGAID